MGMTAVGLRETRGYLHRIRNKLPQVQKHAVGGPEALSLLHALAKADVISEVYTRYQPDFYERLGVIHESVKAEVINDEPFQVAIFIPLNADTEAIAGSAAGQMTYARFMLPEFAKDSFFKGDAKASIPRDFLSEWQKTFIELVPNRVIEAIDQEIRA